MPKTVSCLRSLTVVSCVVFIAGCGSGGSPNAAHWSGNVTISGVAAPEDAEGSITFRPQGNTGKPVTVRIVNGKYDSPNTPKGKIMAYVDLKQPTGKSRFDERLGKEIPIMKNLVPPERMRGIELNISEDKSDANIDI